MDSKDSEIIDQNFMDSKDSEITDQNFMDSKDSEITDQNFMFDNLTVKPYSTSLVMVALWCLNKYTNKEICYSTRLL